MSEDIRKEPVSPVRAGLPLAPPDQPVVDDGARPPLPWKTRSVGAIWIVAGALLFLLLILLLPETRWLIFRLLQGDSSAWLFFSLAMPIVVALSGAAFIRAGVRIVRSAWPRRLSKGLAIYSVVSGLLLAFLSLDRAFYLLALVRGGVNLAGADTFLLPLFYVATFLISPLLLAAGFLALSEDVPRGPTYSQREGHPAEGYGPTPDFARTPYPLAASAAAIVWILFGCLVAVNVRNEVFGMGLSGLWGDDGINGAASFILADSGHPTAGGFWGSVVMGLIRVAFLFAGIQTLRCAPRDTLGMGIASMFVAVLLVKAGFMVMGITDSSDAFIAGEEAAAMLAAGILALVGRKQYVLWRKAPAPRRDPQDAGRQGTIRF